MVNNIYKLVENNSQALDAIANTTGFSQERIKSDLQPGNGPTVDILPMSKGARGGSSGIVVDPALIKALASIDGGNKKVLSNKTFGTALTILHEYGHHGDQVTNNGKNTGQYFDRSGKRVPYSSIYGDRDNKDMGIQKWKTTLSGHRGDDITIMGFGVTVEQDKNGETTIKQGQLSESIPQEYKDKVPKSLPSEANGENILKTLNVK